MFDPTHSQCETQKGRNLSKGNTNMLNRPKMRKSNGMLRRSRGEKDFNVHAMIWRNLIKMP